MGSDGATAPLRLGDFILENIERILAEWEDFARRFWVGPLPPVARLRNDAEEMLRTLVQDMASPRTAAEQKARSEGHNGGDRTGMNQAAVGHALARVDDGFDIARMVAEFRALRASVSRIWWESVPTPHREQIEDMRRFNEALDHLVATSVAAFAERLDRSRQLFLGILGHDLRQPLYSMKMFIEIMSSSATWPEDLSAIPARMERCCDSMGKMLADLLDFTTSQLGSSMPVYPDTADLEAICREVLEEFRALAPDRDFKLQADGDLRGEWDAARLRQLISNLLSNAKHHGAPDHPITTMLRETAEEVTLAVHNRGRPIPQESLGILFDPMVRLTAGERNRPQGSIGLGLYICRQIAVAHGGKIHVESSAEDGTTFTVRLPKSRRKADGVDGAKRRTGADGVDGAKRRSGADGVDGAKHRSGRDGAESFDGAKHLDGSR